MKLDAKVEVNLKSKEVGARVKGAAAEALKKVIVLIANDTIKGSPVLTGNNRRSIMFESEGLKGAIYSTSGYGGMLETGTAKRAATPYFKPALDRNIGKLSGLIKEEVSKL